MQKVLDALASVEQATAAPSKVEPSAPVKKSVLVDHIVCLDGGKHFSMLRRHLMTDHKITQEHPQRWELPSSYPLVAPDYAKTRSSLLGPLPHLEDAETGQTDFVTLLQIAAVSVTKPPSTTSAYFFGAACCATRWQMLEHSSAQPTLACAASSLCCLPCSPSLLLRWSCFPS